MLTSVLRMYSLFFSYLKRKKKLYFYVSYSYCEWPKIMSGNQVIFAKAIFLSLTTSSRWREQQMNNFWLSPVDTVNPWDRLFFQLVSVAISKQVTASFKTKEKLIWETVPFHLFSNPYFSRWARTTFPYPLFIYFQKEKHPVQSSLPSSLSLPLISPLSFLCHCSYLGFLQSHELAQLRRQKTMITEFPRVNV